MGRRREEVPPIARSNSHHSRLSHARTSPRRGAHRRRWRQGDGAGSEIVGHHSGAAQLRPARMPDMNDSIAARTGRLLTQHRWPSCAAGGCSHWEGPGAQGLGHRPHDSRRGHRRGRNRALPGWSHAPGRHDLCRRLDTTWLQCFTQRWRIGTRHSASTARRRLAAARHAACSAAGCCVPPAAAASAAANPASLPETQAHRKLNPATTTQYAE